MPEKDPTTYSWFTYAWVIAIGAVGGFVNFAKRVREGSARAFNIPELIGEIVTSGFVAVLTFYGCEYLGIDQLASALVIGITAHMATRTLFLSEVVLESVVKKALKRINIDGDKS